MIEALIIGFIWYQIIAHVGISAGLHRYWAHKAFKAGVFFETITLYMSVLAGSRSPIGWISAHRMHHHHSDTELDPHSPNTKGFWKVFFSLWTIPNIPPKYVKDLYQNSRIVFFHKHWRKIWLISAVVSFIISPYFFVSFVVVPAILAPVGFGLVNALTHYNNKVKNVPWINILVAGEGYHKGHHEGRIVRYHQYDHTGYIIEKLINIGFLQSSEKC
jgi:stearoyl-CoA desaturase (delta-9 desaturase)